MTQRISRGDNYESRRETLFEPIQDFDVQGLVGSGLDDATGGKQGDGIPLNRHAGISEGEAEVDPIGIVQMSSEVGSWVFRGHE